jgi:hypothetical protein
MSGNDQPPYPPRPQGPPPGEEPTRIAGGRPPGQPGQQPPQQPPYGQPGGQGGQGGQGGPPYPPTAQFGAVPPRKPVNKLVIIGAVLGVLLVLGGGIGAAFAFSGGGDDDRDSDGDGGSKVAFCETFDEFDSDEAEEDPAKAAENLRDAGTPDDMPDDARDGLEVIIEIAEDAEDGEDARHEIDQLEGEDQENLEALVEYVEECEEGDPSDASDSPTSATTDDAASTEEFCDAMESMTSTSDDDFDADPGKLADLLRDAGTPDDMPDDAARGREVMIEIADSASTGDDAEQAFEDLSATDEAATDAFFTYWTETCMGLATDGPTSLPSASTIDPSDYLSDYDPSAYDPSDYLSDYDPSDYVTD